MRPRSPCFSEDVEGRLKSTPGEGEGQRLQDPNATECGEQAGVEASMLPRVSDEGGQKGQRGLGCPRRVCIDCGQPGLSQVSDSGVRFRNSGTLPCRAPSAGAED